jgi:hypothetical protein
MALRTFLTLSMMMILAFLPAETAQAEAPPAPNLIDNYAEAQPEPILLAQDDAYRKMQRRENRARKREAGKARKQAEAAEAKKVESAAASKVSSGSASLMCSGGKVVYPKNPTRSEKKRCARPIPKMKIVGKGATTD